MTTSPTADGHIPGSEEGADRRAAGPDDYAQEYLDRGGDRLGLHIYPEPELSHGAGAAAAAPVVVIWPAMGVPARFYKPLASQLRAAGLAAIAVDLRGTGSSTPRASRRSRYGYTELVADVGAVLSMLRPRLAGRPVLLLGHSLGGQACVLHLALTAANGPTAATVPDGATIPTDHANVDGLVLVAVGLPYFRTYSGRRSVGVLTFTQTIVAASTLMRVWPGWGFGGRQAHGVITDWGYTARHGRFPHLAGADVDAALTLVRTPILAISIDGDHYTPARTLDHLCAKLPAAPVDRIHVSQADAAAPLDHFRWVRAAEPVATLVARWQSGLGAASEPPTRSEQRSRPA